MISLYRRDALILFLDSLAPLSELLFENRLRDRSQLLRTGRELFGDAKLGQGRWGLGSFSVPSSLRVSSCGFLAFCLYLPQPPLSPDANLRSVNFEVLVLDLRRRRSAESCQMPSLYSNPWPALPSAHLEARLLFEMVGRNGSTTTPEAIRSLIDVPRDIEDRLRHYARFISCKNPHEARSVLRVISWRKEVLSQFDRLTSQ